MGRAADKWGRRFLIPAGIGVASLTAGLLALRLPLFVAAIAVTVLSLGYDMTQPLLGGIVTQLAPDRPGQAMGLNVFCLFTGFGLGSLFFGMALRNGFSSALILFAGVQGACSLLALLLFASERSGARSIPVPS